MLGRLLRPGERDEPYGAPEPEEPLVPAPTADPGTAEVLDDEEEASAAAAPWPPAPPVAVLLPPLTEMVPVWAALLPPAPPVAVKT